jgi:hypothetical protein
MSSIFPRRFLCYNQYFKYIINDLHLSNLSMEGLVKKANGMQRIIDKPKYNFILFLAGVNGLFSVKTKSMQRHVLRSSVSKLKNWNIKSFE